MRRPPTPTLFPSTALFRPLIARAELVEPAAGDLGRPLRRDGGPVDAEEGAQEGDEEGAAHHRLRPRLDLGDVVRALDQRRSEEHTSELQSRQYLVCRLLLE